MRAWLIVGSVFAASMASAADVWSKDGWVIINEVLVLRPRTGENRAQVAAQRLAAIADNKIIEVIKSESGFALSVGTTRILSVEADEARAQNSTPEALATLWAQRINDARSLPALKSSVSRVVLPDGGTTSVSLVGSAARRATFTIEPANAVTLERTTGMIAIKPKISGAVTLKAVSGNQSLLWTIRTAPYAASPGGPYVAEVTGFPANSETVAASAAAAVQSQLQTKPGSMIRIRSVGGARLTTGQETTVPVEVTVHGEGYFPWSGRVLVRVKNSAARFSSAEDLWYSNSPENIYTDQPLFAATLNPSAPVRMLCHHRNRSAAPLFNVLSILNTSEAPAKIALITGDGGVDTNPTLAGYRAGDRFLTSFGESSALIVTLPPGRMLPVHVHEMNLGETSSAIHYFALLNEEPGQGVKVIQQVQNPSDVPVEWLAASRTDRPYTFTPSTAIPEGFKPPEVRSPVYPTPTKREEFQYDFGGRIVFLRLGQVGIAGTDGNPLLGNFGVTYEFQGRLTNPTDKPVDIEVAFEASAGYTGSLMWVNGEYVRIPLLQPKEERIFRTVRLVPGQSQSIRISTMPLSGASYPATITIRPKGFNDL
ncbi:MAG: hypothetical protein KF812_09285 [Fimbriimonadaceae bacterium]|nr:hypothetical protein [Fimbriimonadaceae bacterium]